MFVQTCSCVDIQYTTVQYIDCSTRGGSMVTGMDVRRTIYGSQIRIRISTLLYKIIPGMDNIEVIEEAVLDMVTGCER